MFEMSSQWLEQVLSNSAFRMLGLLFAMIPDTTISLFLVIAYVSLLIVFDEKQINQGLAEGLLGVQPR